jgi:hypothetical protein
MLAGPSLATPQQPAAIVEKSPMRKPASPVELDQYKAREQKAQPQLEKFEGGRGRGIEATTLVLILLIVILVLILV